MLLSDLLYVVFVFLFIIGLILFSAFLYKKIQKNAPMGYVLAKKPRTIRIVSHVSLGVRSKAVLIDAQGKSLLVGVSPTGVNLLHEFSDQDEDQFKSFKETLDEKTGKQ